MAGETPGAGAGSAAGAVPGGATSAAGGVTVDGSGGTATGALPSAPSVNVGGQLGAPTAVTPGLMPTAAPTPSDWTAQLTPDNRGWLLAKGVGDAGQLVDLARGTEKFLGVPKDQLAILPKDSSDVAGARAILTRLGAPADAAGYGLKADLAQGGKQEFTDGVAGIFLKASLTTAQAAIVATEWNAMQANMVASQAAQYEAQVQQSKQQLSGEWGTAHDQNTAIAKRAAAKFGVTAEVIGALEKSSSYAAVMKTFYAIGAGMGEAQFVNGVPGVGVLLPEQAKAEKEMLLNDQGWKDSYLKGDAAKIKRMLELNAAELGISL